MDKKRFCPECHTLMEHKQVALHFERDGFVADLKEVPAYVCPQCGTEILSASVAEEASRIIEFLFKSAQTPSNLFPRARLSFHKAAA